jgi:transposase
MNAAVNLPDDVDALKAIILAQSEQNARLEALIAALRQAMFGRKSEKIDPDQFELTLEGEPLCAIGSSTMASEAGIARVEAEGEANELVTATATTRPRKTNRGSLPKHLPRIEEIIDPEETACACGTERHVIGEDVS